MQAIQVKFIPATDTKPLRVKAWCYAKVSATIALDTDQDDNASLRKVVLQLLDKLWWDGAWIGGSLPNGDYAFVCIEPKAPRCVAVQ